MFEHLNLSDIKDFKVDKIKALTSKEAIEAYDYGLEASDIKDCEVDKIKALTSKEAMEAYKTNKVDYAQIIHLSTDKLYEFFNVIKDLQELGKDINTQEILASAQFFSVTEPRETLTFTQRLEKRAARGVGFF